MKIFSLAFLYPNSSSSRPPSALPTLPLFFVTSHFQFLLTFSSPPYLSCTPSLPHPQNTSFITISLSYSFLPTSSTGMMTQTSVNESRPLTSKYLRSSTQQSSFGRRPLSADANPRTEEKQSTYVHRANKASVHLHCTLVKLVT